MKENMKSNNCDQFFSVLAETWNSPVKVLLLGGSAAQVYGGARPTFDVDFETALLEKSQNWEDFEKAVQQAEEQTGIGAQFSENIDRWSQVSYLDYRDHLKKYKEYNKIKVSLLTPPYWSIGKITRYLDSDVQDMMAVFSAEKVDSFKLAKLWLQALQKSPQSTELFITKKNAVHFFESNGEKIWGPSFPKDKIMALGFV